MKEIFPSCPSHACAPFPPIWLSIEVLSLRACRLRGHNAARIWPRTLHLTLEGWAPRNPKAIARCQGWGPREVLLRKLSNSPPLRPLLEGELDLGALGVGRGWGHRHRDLSVPASLCDPGECTVVAGSTRGCGGHMACPCSREACAGERGVERKDALQEVGRLRWTGGAVRGPGICGSELYRANRVGGRKIKPCDPAEGRSRVARGLFSLYV